MYGNKEGATGNVGNIVVFFPYSEVFQKGSPGRWQMFLIQLLQTEEVNSYTTPTMMVCTMPLIGLKFLKW